MSAGPLMAHELQFSDLFYSSKECRPRGVSHVVSQGMRSARACFQPGGRRWAPPLRVAYTVSLCPSSPRWATHPSALGSCLHPARPLHHSYQLHPTPPNSTQPSIVCRPCRFESCFTDASNAEASSDVLQAALPRMQQLTCLVLDNPALDQDVLTAAAGIQTLQRLNASAQWVVLPPGHWQTTVRSLVSVPVLRVSISGWLGPQQGCKHASQAAWHSWHVCRWTGTHLTSPATE